MTAGPQPVSVALVLADRPCDRRDPPGGEDAEPSLISSLHRVRADTTIRRLLEDLGQSTVVQRIEARELGLARHGRRAWLDELLVDGDRVEIVRPIVADARAARFARVAARKGVNRRRGAG